MPGGMAVGGWRGRAQGFLHEVGRDPDKARGGRTLHFAHELGERAWDGAWTAVLTFGPARARIPGRHRGTQHGPCRDARRDGRAGVLADLAAHEEVIGEAIEVFADVLSGHLAVFGNTGPEMLNAAPESVAPRPQVAI
jgi:hypothetical protein